MNEIFTKAYEIKDTILADRRALHQIPEIAFELPQTVAYVTKRLKEIGCEPFTVGNNGVGVLISGNTAGKVILLRADMDALPMKEESGLPFSAKGDSAHTCGHDLHSAMLLGAAKILLDMKEKLNGTVKLIFQPAEETLAGARSMIDGGIMQNPKVDGVFGMHVAADYPVGFLGYKIGSTHASADSFKITIKGKGCHGAMPHLGIDPINVGLHIHLALQEIITREVITTEPVVITVGKFTSGTSYNIIPESAEMCGTIRIFNPEVREYVVKRVKEITENVAKAFNASATVEFVASIPSVLNEKGMVELMLDTLQQANLKGAWFGERTTMGSEDFAYYSLEAPSAFLSLGGAQKDKDKRFGAHNPHIIFDEDCLPIGAGAYAAYAFSWLKNY